MALYSPKRARRSLIDTIAFRALSQVATMAGFVIFVRAMPEEDFGVFSLLYAFIPVVSTLASLGLEQTLRRYQPEYLSSGNLAGAYWLVRFIASARFGTNLILLALILATWNYVAPTFKLTPYRDEFAVFGVLIVVNFQARILQLSLAAHMLHRFSAGSVAITAIVKFSVYWALASLNSLTLVTAILADTMASAIAYVFLLAAFRKHCRPPMEASRFRPDAAERKRLFRYGALNNFNDAGAMVLSSKSDNFFIAAFMDPIAVGVYALYTRLNQMLVQLQPARLFENIVQPLFFAVDSSEADERLPRYFTLLMNTSLLLQWPALVYAVVYHHEIIAFVFDGKFGEYSWLMPLVIFFGVLEGVARPVTLVAQYEEKAGIVLISKLFAGYNVVAFFVLIPYAGVYGAVLATGTAALFKNAFIWWHVRRRARWVGAGSLVLRGALTWGGVMAFCSILNYELNLSLWADLLVGLATCGVAELFYLRTAALSPSDRSLLASLLRGKEARLLRALGVITIDRHAKS